VALRLDEPTRPTPAHGCQASQAALQLLKVVVAARVLDLLADRGQRPAIARRRRHPRRWWSRPWTIDLESPQQVEARFELETESSGDLAAVVCEVARVLQCALRGRRDGGLDGDRL